MTDALLFHCLIFTSCLTSLVTQLWVYDLVSLAYCFQLHSPISVMLTPNSRTQERCLYLPTLLSFILISLQSTAIKFSLPEFALEITMFTSGFHLAKWVSNSLSSSYLSLSSTWHNRAVLLEKILHLIYKHYTLLFPSYLTGHCF